MTATEAGPPHARGPPRSSSSRSASRCWPPARLDELSVELIAKAAGISRGLLFHYFSSKQEFHVEVAKAAAAEMLRRTGPDTSLAPVDALRGALTSFIDYVEENPDNYRSLVRGAVSGDAEMRAIFDATRATMAQRVLDVLATQGLDVTPRATLAIHGWVAFVEECVIRWIDTRTVDACSVAGHADQVAARADAVGLATKRSTR